VLQLSFVLDMEPAKVMMTCRQLRIHKVEADENGTVFAACDDDQRLIVKPSVRCARQARSQPTTDRSSRTPQSNKAAPARLGVGTIIR